MAHINENYEKLRAGYLFPEIGRRVATFQKDNPDARLIKLGIGDVTKPLAPAIGNAVELAEVLAVLRDPRPDSRLCALSLALAGEVLDLAGLYTTAEEGARAALGVLHSGAAAEKFGAMIHAMKGPARLLDDPARFLPVAPARLEVTAATGGRVAAIDGVALGQLVQRLGGGRVQADDPIDYRVGLTGIVSIFGSVGVSP